jgi:hypothetical protein
MSQAPLPLTAPTATPASHRCAAVGCQHEVRRGYLMCLDHWRMVPKPVQRDVWAWYRLMGLASAPRDAATRYHQAVQAAVDAVHTKGLARVAKRDANTRPLF